MCGRNSKKLGSSWVIYRFTVILQHTTVRPPSRQWMNDDETITFLVCLLFLVLSLIGSSVTFLYPRLSPFFIQLEINIFQLMSQGNAYVTPVAYRKHLPWILTLRGSCSTPTDSICQTSFGSCPWWWLQVHACLLLLCDLLPFKIIMVQGTSLYHLLCYLVDTCGQFRCTWEWRLGAT